MVGVIFANWLDSLVELKGTTTDDAYYVNASNRIRSLGAEGEVRWEPGGGTLLSLSVTRQRVEELRPKGSGHSRMRRRPWSRCACCARWLARPCG